MSEAKRIELINKIEEIRESKVITYIISDRPKIRNMMEESDIREIYHHVRKIGNTNKIDLYIYSRGGVSTIAWALANLIREYAKDFSVLVPFRAFSCATSLAVGANKLIMHKASFLGPVDPMVANPFNPIINNNLTPISVEDVGGYLSLIKDKFDIKDQSNVTKGFEKLASVINPLALGNVYRHYLKSRDDVKKLLELHLDPKKEKDRIDKIVEILAEKLYFHGHHINREEAKGIGLTVEFAEKYSHGNDNLSDVMWELFEEYEKDLELNMPYRDKLPTGGNINEIPTRYIESTTLSSVHIIEQTMTDLGFSAGSKLINIPVGNKLTPAVFIPGAGGVPPQTIIISSRGQPVFLNNTIYDKEEISYWKRKSIN